MEVQVPPTAMLIQHKTLFQRVKWSSTDYTWHRCSEKTDQRSGAIKEAFLQEVPAWIWNWKWDLEKEEEGERVLQAKVGDEQSQVVQNYMQGAA